MALSEACILQSTSYWDHCILSGETDAKREGRLASVSPRVLCSPHNNQLTALPESFDNLTNLQELYAKNNRLISLPTSLGNMARLKEICVSDNQLTALPDSLGNLTRLTFLDLRANTLVSLPAAIGGLPNLEKVGARWNKLSSLPKWFQRLEQRGCTVYIERQETGTSSHDRVFSCMGERKRSHSHP